MISTFATLQLHNKDGLVQHSEQTIGHLLPNQAPVQEGPHQLETVYHHHMSSSFLVHNRASYRLLVKGTQVEICPGVADIPQQSADIRLGKTEIFLQNLEI
jgi:hypothetical protein